MFMSKYTFQIIYLSAYLFQFAAIAHILKGYDIYFNFTSYPIVNVQDFINGLWASILELCWSGSKPNMSRVYGSGSKPNMSRVYGSITILSSV